MKHIIDFTLLFLSFLSVVPVGAAEVTYSTVEGDEGIPLVVAESGNPQGAAVLFIHGFSQGILSWKYQLDDRELQKRFRMVALDLRGHGASGKPWLPQAYDKKAYGSDIDAVIKAKNLDHPILVSWSFGGGVTMAYIREHGITEIRGLILVAAATLLDGPMKWPPLTDPVIAKQWEMFQQMGSENVAINLAASKQFVASLVAKPLSIADTEQMLMLNMLTPAYVRKASIHIADNSDLAGKVDVPTLIIQGDKDGLTPMEVSVSNKKNIQCSKLLIYEGVGHAPFLEAPVRFNQDIARFIEQMKSHKPEKYCED